MHIRLTILLSMIFIGFPGCKISENGKSATPDQIKKLGEEAGTFYTLGDYLERVPGVQFMNGTYQIRGIQSLNVKEPLYVIDGAIVGNDYVRANSLLNFNEIASVKVLKQVHETSRYGLMGGAGVIEIKTKVGGS